MPTDTHALSLRETPYYSLELHVHLQMLYSPLRVLTPEEADIVCVPTRLAACYGEHVAAEPLPSK